MDWLLDLEVLLAVAFCALFAWPLVKKGRKMEEKIYLTRTQRLLWILCLLALLAGGCAEVPFYERDLFADRIMEFDNDEVESTVEGKIYSSREGGGGSLGATAGGGCGCN